MAHSATTDAPAPLTFRQEFSPLLRALRDFLVTLWSTEGRGTLTLLSIAIVLVICATVGAQVALNAWNRPFYDAIQARDLAGFAYQSLVFCVIAGTLLILNVAQAWLREMIKLKSREWLTRELFAEWLEPGRPVRLAYAGEIGVNPDQRIQQDASQLTELAADLGTGLLQALLLLIAFLGVLWGLSGAITIPIGGYSLTIPGYMVWCAFLFAAIGSWLAWRVGAPLVGLNARRFQRESGLRFALVQINQQAEDVTHHHREESEKQRLGRELDKILVVMREIVTATAKVTWVTAGYGWISLIAPIVIAAPAYFGGSLSFGELMMVVGGFQQVNQSLRWFVDNFSALADWRATLLRVANFRAALLATESQQGAGRQIEYVDGAPGSMAFEELEVDSPVGREGFQERHVVIRAGEHVLICGAPGEGKTPLFRALSGLWPWGSGRIIRPQGETVMYVPRGTPYLPRGTLREALAYPTLTDRFSDRAYVQALERTGLGRYAKSLDEDRRWDRELREDEQMALAFARVALHAPDWVVFDDTFSVLEDDTIERIIELLTRDLKQTTIIHIGRSTLAHVPLFSRVLHMKRLQDDAVEEEWIAERTLRTVP